MAHMKEKWSRAIRVSREIGARLTRSSLQMDVTDKGSIRNAVKVVEEAEGALHILVNK